MDRGTEENALRNTREQKYQAVSPVAHEVRNGLGPHLALSTRGDLEKNENAPNHSKTGKPALAGGIRRD